jgi:hypothetical protein
MTILRVFPSCKKKDRMKAGEIEPKQGMTEGGSADAGIGPWSRRPEQYIVPGRSSSFVTSDVCAGKAKTSLEQAGIQNPQPEHVSSISTTG